jgi:hypothetical protein
VKNVRDGREEGHKPGSGGLDDFATGNHSGRVVVQTSSGRDVPDLSSTYFTFSSETTESTTLDNPRHTHLTGALCAKRTRSIRERGGKSRKNGRKKKIVNANKERGYQEEHPARKG